jgi:hypothetical protein
MSRRKKVARQHKIAIKLLVAAGQPQLMKLHV